MLLYNIQEVAHHGIDLQADLMVVNPGNIFFHEGIALNIACQDLTLGGCIDICGELHYDTCDLPLAREECGPKACFVE